MLNCHYNKEANYVSLVQLAPYEFELCSKVDTKLEVYRLNTVGKALSAFQGLVAKLGG